MDETPSSEINTNELAGIKTFKQLRIDNVDIQVPYSPMMTRKDIKGVDDELSGMEELYLREIEQV